MKHYPCLVAQELRLPVDDDVAAVVESAAFGAPKVVLQRIQSFGNGEESEKEARNVREWPFTPDYLLRRMVSLLLWPPP